METGEGIIFLLKVTMILPPSLRLSKALCSFLSPPGVRKETLLIILEAAHLAVALVWGVLGGNLGLSREPEAQDWAVGSTV